jgi:hypothetical protein
MLSQVSMWYVHMISPSRHTPTHQRSPSSVALCHSPMLLQRNELARVVCIARRESIGGPGVSDPGVGWVEERV